MNDVIANPKDLELDVRAISQLIRTLQQNAPAEGERRSDPRRLVAAPALVLPLDGRLRPVGAPQRMVVRDISSRGICLLHSQMLRTPYANVDFEGDEVFVEILWRRAVGLMYAMGGKLVRYQELASAVS